MRINTITCHNVYNYGASLQAYALQHYLEMLGHEVKIIDFQPYYHQNRYNIAYVPISSNYYNLCHNNLILRYLYGFIKNRDMFKTWGRKRAFDDFTKQYLRLTVNRYETSEQLQRNPPLADIYIAGSDQIWNTDSKNGREPAYYLDFGDKEVRKISYAASFAVNKIKTELIDFVKTELKKIDIISVRESTALSILDNLGFKGEQVLDPVFLLNKNDWVKISMESKKYNQLNNDGYVLIYDFIGDERIKKLASDLKNKFNIPIVSINDFNMIDYADTNINNAGPLEFLSLLNNARHVISNSFHATAFSTILEKDFYVFPVKQQNNSSRMEDFLKQLNLSSRFCCNSIDEKDINYGAVYTMIANKIDHSKKFICSSLNI